MTREEVIAALNERDEDLKLQSISQIGDLGEPCAAALGIAPEIVALLEDPSSEIQKEAMLALGKFGSEGAAHCKKVAEFLGSPEPSVAAAACNSLRLMGQGAAGTLPYVLQCAKHQDATIRAAALMAAGALSGGSDVKGLLDGLNDQSPMVVSAACAALASAGESGKASAADVAKLLSSSVPDNKAAALNYFAQMGSLASSYGSDICKCLADPDPVVRGTAVNVFWALGTEALPMAKDVAALLSKPSAGIKCAAAVVLGTMGEKAVSPVASTIAGMLSDDSEDTEAKMLAAACVIGKPSAAVRLPKCAAAQALACLGAKEKPAYVDKVAALLEDANPEVRASAAKALGMMGAAAVKKEEDILTLLADKDVRVVSGAAIALGMLAKATGGASLKTVETVVALLSSQHPSIRADTCTALGMMGENVFLFTDKLMKCFKDRCSQVKCALVTALPAMGPKAQVYAPDIARLMYEDDVKLRAASAAALGGMGDRGAALAEEVLELLVDAEAEVRGAAVRTLGCFGEESAPFLDAINEMQADPVESVRCDAAEAYGKVVAFAGSS